MMSAFKRASSICSLLLGFSISRTIAAEWIFLALPFFECPFVLDIGFPAACPFPRAPFADCASLRWKCFLHRPLLFCSVRTSSQNSHFRGIADALGGAGVATRPLLTFVTASLPFTFSSPPSSDRDSCFSGRRFERESKTRDDASPMVSIPGQIGEPVKQSEQSPSLYAGTLTPARSR